MPASRGRRSGWSDARGQAAVELAMAMPLVVFLALGVVQVALVARDQLALELVAREAARAAAVSADPVGAASAAAHRVTGLGPLDIAVTVSGDLVRVTVSYTNPTDVALIGPLVAEAELSATAAMALEPPPAGRVSRTPGRGGAGRTAARHCRRPRSP